MLGWERRRLHRQLSGPAFGSAPPPTIFSIWSLSDTPANLLDPDPTALTLGVEFRANTPGDVVGIRFYKGGAANGGTHEGQLWDWPAGNLLNSVVFSGETASGWQTQMFAVPTPILANTTYVISYYAPQGHASFDNNYFTTSGHVNPPLEALEAGIDGGNGVFAIGGPAFPTNVFNATNYWVDVLFEV